ncbi:MULTISPECIES: tripartite tricarboxylate transporter substrate binding protein [unclassified Variovorax]|uniref:tripartite tricarboxylate transporter substrate binding protein n=1 Tax=unclassified Variovorax TaxID=663243 RepID=UPI0008B64D7E|nr:MULTISPECIES: tripartite tricarboxylate transporter substrate binding protein [unclassified Variovorax]SEK15886.1 Tripartite-type tricarboxylate transporter, receptor component TctC [Variovorax sp. OK202]SFE22982.1 Tripartite-type tricarboxylate transporter, receptor component TctC [Variovorax sp. OK212]
MKKLVRHLALGLTAGAALLTAAGAHAQAYPAKTTTLVVGFAPGGSGDILARMVAQKLTTSLGQPVIVDNRPGAGGTIANSFVANASADGYTLLFVTSGFPGSTALYPKLNYDTVKSFAPVAKVGASPVVMVAPAGSPLHSLADVLATARKAPGKLNYAAGGGGATTTSLAAEFLKSEAKVDMLMIPYKGSGPALTALMGHEVDLGFDIPSSALPLIRSGKLRALAVTTKARSAALPDVPTVAETAVPNFEVTGWFGILAPAGTPPEVVARLNKDVNAALAMPDVKERLQALGVEPAHGSPAEFGQLIASETKRYGDAIRRLGLKAD